MHSSLFVASIPPERDAWRTFLNRAQTAPDFDRSVVRLAENVWLVNFRSNPPALGYLISSAVNLGVAYGILAFEHEPEWLPVGFDPETILGRSE